MENLLSANPVAFYIGNWPIRVYALILTAGIVLALLYGIYRFKKAHYTSEFMLEVFLWCIPLAIVFARIVYVIAHPSSYFPINNWDDFINAIAIWEGGITIIGGVIGGVIGICIACSLRHKNMIQICDLLVPCLLLGQIIGRWGNYVNEEAYGVLITNPALQFFPFAVLINGQWHAATFFYEMMLNALGLVILLLIDKKVRHNGLLTTGYLIWYGAVRAIMESIREDAVVTEGGIGVTQIFCIVFALIGVVVFILIAVGVFDKIANGKFKKYLWKDTLPRSMKNDDFYSLSTKKSKQASTVLPSDSDNGKSKGGE